jgi:hypothetical protein
MDASERLFEEQLKGHCCSEAIMNMALEDMGWTEEDRSPLVKAMGAFCGGLQEGLACGTLCAAKAVLFLAEKDYHIAQNELGPELMAWFKERFGSWNCLDILEGDATRKPTVCPPLIEGTYNKLRDMLEDIGTIE